jgi:C4-dicarboxylate transporter DctM subunit
VVICTLSIGFMTPPLGEHLLVASGIGGETVEKIVVRVLPFVFVSAIATFVIAYFPQISLWLPSQLGY